MRTVLLTGATGTVGSAIVPLLLEEEGTRLRLLIRSSSREPGNAKTERMFRYWEVDPVQALRGGRVEVVAGDVCRPRLGLAPADYERLASEVTHVIHAAGNVKLNQSMEEARQNAVGSARKIAAFSEACRERGQFEKLEFVSTVGVAGRRRGAVPEEPLPPGRRFRNTYEAAKAEAEDYLLGRIERGLPATIHRLSMVVGDSRTGRALRFQVFYSLCDLFAGKGPLRAIPRARQVTVDIVPADYVARAVLLSASDPDAGGRIFHLCSGPDQALTLRQLAERVGEIRSRSDTRRYPLLEIPPGLIRFCLPLLRAAAPQRLRRLLGAAPFLLSYLSEPQTFENERTRSYFSKTLALPSVGEYIGRVLEYYWHGPHRQESAVGRHGNAQTLRVSS